MVLLQSRVGRASQRRRWEVKEGRTFRLTPRARSFEVLAAAVMAGGGDAGDDGGDPPRACGEGPVGRGERKRQSTRSGAVRLAPSTLPAGEGAGTLQWATCSQSWSTIFVSTTSCAPRVFAAPVRGRKAVCTPPGVQGKARSLVTYCSQQRRPGRVPRFIGAYHHRQYTVPLCLGVRDPGVAVLRSIRVV